MPTPRNAFLEAVERRIERERMERLDTQARAAAPVTQTREAALRRAQSQRNYARRRAERQPTETGAGTNFKAAMRAGDVIEARRWWRRCDYRYQRQLRLWAIDEGMEALMGEVRGPLHKVRMPR